jgi:hypothetical protein
MFQQRQQPARAASPSHLLHTIISPYHVVGVAIATKILVDFIAPEFAWKANLTITAAATSARLPF